MNIMTSNAILICSIIFISCSSNGKVLAKQQVKGNIEKNVESRNSNFAKLFINDLKKELNKQKISINKYKPSKQLIANYGIQYFNGEYFLQGFATTNNKFNQAELNRLKIATGRPMGNEMTIRIPLKSFLQFLELQGIQYFEMNPIADIK